MRGGKWIPAATAAEAAAEAAGRECPDCRLRAAEARIAAAGANVIVTRDDTFAR